ncbi:hypothetical protein DITRI_Ditri02bG0020000 [Diplodiscus trichospermus]
MKIQNFPRWISLTLSVFIILVSQSQSHAKQTETILENLTIDSFVNKTLQWRSHMTKFHGKRLKLSAPTVLAGVFCFIAASISSAGGIGGGGLFIPILTIVAGLDLKTASNFSAFMVTGGSIANVSYNFRAKSAKFGVKCLIDYDIALLSEPCMLLGVSVGVHWVGHWKMESDRHQETRNGYEKQESWVIQNGVFGKIGETKSLEEPLVGLEGTQKSRFPWKNILVLIMVWFSFFVIYLLRGNRYGQGIIPMKPCGVGYWALSLFQIPLAIAFTAWILCRKEAIACQDPNKQGVNKLVFPLMALLAGGLGGVFGIGGGMLISPLLLQVG